MARLMGCALACLSIVFGSLEAAQQPSGSKDQGTTTTSGKHPRQAKTQQEYVDYNTASVISAGREELGAKLTQKLDQQTRLLSQALYTRDVATGGARHGRTLSQGIGTGRTRRTSLRALR